jgi:hypothetical protein
MGYWGVKSFENDDAGDALDRAFERVHGPAYDELMDDRSPLTFDQVHQKLANAETLAAALEELRDAAGSAPEDWDEVTRLAFAGIVVRHAELGVPIPEDVRLRALEWLEGEEIEWEETTARGLRRQKEIALLSGTRSA